jgi:two-component system, cell cycle response regulator
VVNPYDKNAPQEAQEQLVVEEPNALTTSKLSYDQLVRTLPQGNPRVVIVEGSALGRILELARNPITIGRDPRNTLCLDESGVSRTHAVIMHQSQGVIVRDVGSKNGTFVNREPVQEHVLVDGDMIQLGSTTLKYLSQNNPEHSYYEHLHQASVQDPVTDIPNRRYFEEFVQREIARTRRYDRPLALLMIDLDHFKKVNDTYGHVCGDAVLHDFAHVVSARLRQSEFLARYGGEEFALTLPETNLRGASIVAESIRLLVEKHGFTWENHTLAVTISIGGALLGPDMTSVGELVQAADQELYKAKRGGRNRVCLAGGY